MLSRRTIAALLGLLACTLVLPAGAQDSLDDARSRREEVRAQAAEAAAQIDVLQAEDAEIVAALADTEEWIAAQEAKLATAEQDLAATLETEAEARHRAAELDGQIADLEDLIARQSVSSYVAGFTNEDGLLLNADDINSVPMLRFVLDETTGANEATTDLLRAARDRQADAVAEAEAASEQAQTLRDDIEVRLVELEASRLIQQDLKAEMDNRIAELQDTATVLADEDARIEAFIVAEEARIAAEEEARRRAEEEERRRQEEEARRAEEEQRAAEAAAEEEQTDQGTDAEDPGGQDDTAPQDSAEEAPPPPPDTGGAPAFIRPVPGGVGSGFGNRVHPVYGTQRMHTGLDFNAGSGTPIVAAADGTVIFVGPFSGYGNTVIVQHSGGYSSLYAHMSSFNTSNGTQVNAGQTIGFVGSTGLSTGPHLHFEIRRNGGAIDPAAFL